MPSTSDEFDPGLRPLKFKLWAGRARRGKRRGLPGFEPKEDPDDTSERRPSGSDTFRRAPGLLPKSSLIAPESNSKKYKKEEQQLGTENYLLLLESWLGWVPTPSQSIFSGCGMGFGLSTILASAGVCIKTALYKKGNQKQKFFHFR